MLFLWNYTVHWPMEAPEELLVKYKSRTGPGLNDTRYGAMIEAMDSSIGRLLAALDRLQLTNETLVYSPQTTVASLELPIIARCARQKVTSMKAVSEFR